MNVDTAWHYVAYTFDDTGNTQKVNIDGQERGSSTYTTSINYTGLGANTQIGRHGDLWGAVDFNGVIDEVRVSSSVRTLSWIATEYNNQSNPGPGTGAFFKTLGSQETNTDVDLADHAAGQEADKFTSASSVTSAELFAFRLTNLNASPGTVNQVQFQLSSVTGISDTDFANLIIYVDDNGDGTIDGSDTTGAVGGAGAVDGSVTTITFSTPFNISASTAVNYILIGDVNNLVPSDTVTIGLGTANITLASGTVGGTAPTSISHTKDSGEVYSYRKPITIDHTQVGASCTSTTDTWQVSANNRDAWDDQTNGDLNQAFFGDSDWRDAGGYQWALEIPQGAIITSAKIRVYSTFHSGVTGAYTARIRVEDVDSASAFTGVVNDIYSRTYWGTTVDWSIPAGGLPINTWSESPDIAALVQHVVDRAGWSPGNYLSIGIWGQTGNGGSNEYTRDYSSNASQAAQLEVTYQSATDSIQDFPVMVKLTGTDFQEVEDNVDADGYDIIFKAEDDTTCGGVGLAPCTLDHEIEVYDETNDLLVAWVRVPTLSATADTTIYIYYGNSSITSPTENPTGVWDSDYVAVWHLHDDFDDSTGSNNGTNYGSSSATGQIADGQDFDGTDDYATMPTGGFSTSAGTVEAWVNIDSFPSSGPEYVFAHRQASPTTDRVYIQLWDNTTWGTGMGDTYDLLRGSTLNIDTWYHLVIRWDGTNVRGYRNGSLDFGPTSYAGLSTVREIFVMAWDPTMEWADGTLDELRISKVARDACWIETEYSNQNDPSTFINVGPEVVIGPSVAVSGTITSSTTENDIVSGSKTIVITLTGDTWVQAGAEFDAQRQNIIDGLNSAQSEANGWNNEVRDKQSVSGVVRTSDTLVTVTLDAQAAYDISANETITVTVPASALVTSTSPLVASPTFDVSYFAPSPLTLTHYRWRNDDGGESASAGWWNVSYLYRKKITFGTSHSLLPLGYTVTVPMDTRPANTNVELTSGNDVRVVWQPTAGGAVELARIGDTWNSAATNIDFRLQSEIGANLDEDPDGSYYVYYGNAAAGTPPTNEMNVYYFADFFNRANSSTVGNGWTEWNDSIASDMYIQSNALYSEGNNVGPPDAGVKRTFPLGALTGNFTLSFDITIQTNAESTWTHYVNVGSSATMVNPNRTMGVGPGIYFGEGGHFVPNSDNYNISNDLTDNMETGITGAQSIRMVVNRGAQTYDYYRGGTLRASGQTYVTSQATLNQIRIANDQYSNTEAAFVYDNVKIVLDVADAPEEALGSEEPYQASGATWAANEDTPLTGLAIGTNIRVRFLVANQGGAGSGPVAYQLEMAETATCGSGSYSAVPGTASSSEHWEIVDSSYINDGQSTFNIDPGLTDPLIGNFTNGELRDDNSNTTGAIDLAAGDFTEIEFAIKTTDYATNGGSYCFRLYDSTNGVALGPSTAYAQVTLASGIFQYRKPITIPSGKVSCAPYIENFPLLVKITDSDLASKARDDGYDIVFRGLDDNVCGGADTSPCGLYHEVERWNGSTGELIAWVRVPRLYSAADNTIYLYYGNANVRVPTENAGAVWDNNNYVVVQHMNQGSALALDDSTINNNDVTTEVSDPAYQATGQIGYAVEFDGNDALEITDPGAGSTLDITAQVTVSAWIRPAAITAWNRIVAKSHTADVSPWTMYGLLFDNASHLREELASGGAQSGANGTSVVPADGSWTYATVTYDHTALRVYFNGSAQGTPTNLNTNIDSNNMPLSIGRSGFDVDYFIGRIDEVRVSSIARETCWIGTEYSNQSNPGNIGSPGFYTIGGEEGSPATAVSLVSFTATGAGAAVEVSWQTAQEVANAGFNLYRAESPAGTFTKINAGLIPALSFSAAGRSYTFSDTGVVVGNLYYYKLEDIDVYGKHTFHGPICVDWDGDGLPDDWEIRYGLNPWANDADIDSDGDGLTNLQEYELGTDPFNPDSDGDGIPDGQEARKRESQEAAGSRQLMRGVEVIAEDETGITLELYTDSFLTELVYAGADEYERLKIADYVHGYTTDVGKAELPLKGVFVDIPAGKVAQLSILETAVEPHSGYRIFPVPQPVVDAQGAASAVGESFVIDSAAYATDAFYPQSVAELGAVFAFREQLKQQLVFYPLSFNAATGELQFYRRIRLRLDYVDDLMAKADVPVASPWTVPAAPSADLSERLAAMGSVAMAFSASPLIVNPLSSMGLVLSSVWAPPAEAGSTAYKIALAEEGLYRIDAAFLTTHGIDPATIDLDAVRLYHLGGEVAILVHDADSPGSFDAGDFIEFFGQPVASAYSKYAKDNIYWLVTGGGLGGPKRMVDVDGSPRGAPTAALHTALVRTEQDDAYVGLAPGADSRDRWYFNVAVPGTDFTGGAGPAQVPFVLDLPGVAGAGSLRISLWGFFDTDHELELWVNDVPQGTFCWSGIAFYEVNLSGLDLTESTSVKLACNNTTDGFVVDYLEATYPRNFAAVDDSLTFSHPGGYRFLIDDFSTAAIRVFDITDPTDVAHLTGVLISPSAPYSLEFEPPAGGGSERFLVMGADSYKTPQAIVADAASDLADTQNGADYILITHKDIGWQASGAPCSWLTDLVTIREGQGLRVKVVDVQDIYDAFSFGLSTPVVIRDFLSYAYSSWQPPAPRYVLLVGDSTYDYKDNYSRGTINFVPAYSIFTDYMGETVTDEYFVTISGDDALPDMYIGRLPAQSAAEAAAMAAKIIAYETAANTGSWEKNVVLIADDQTEAYEAVFESSNEAAAALLPSKMVVLRGYLGDYLVAADLSADIAGWINSGALIVNYSGHASMQQLAAEALLVNADVNTLSNTGMYPFVISMSCLTGYFGYLDALLGPQPSLGEALLLGVDKGAVAALMPTAMTTTAGQSILNTILFEAIFVSDIRQLGAAVASAKQTLLANGDAYFEQISATFLLLGDPATTLKIPLPRMPGGVNAYRHPDGSVHIRWNAALDANGNAVAGYNVYRASSPAGPYRKINAELVTETEYVDSAGSVGADGAEAGASSSYYAVASVDSDGDESAYSLGVSPAALSFAPSSDGGGSSSGTGGAGGAAGGGGCFVASVNRSIPKPLIWFVVLMGIGVAIGCRRPAFAKKLRRASRQRPEAL